MSSLQSPPTPSPLLQLPPDVWQSICAKLLPDDQQSLTHTCKEGRYLVASSVTHLSISQSSMTPLPPTLPTLPAAFTAVRHLTLNSSGTWLAHTLPFLQCSGCLSPLTSLALQFDALPNVQAAQLAQLLGSCHSLAQLRVSYNTASCFSPPNPTSIIVGEVSPGAGLHHLSHSFLQSSQPLHLHLLSADIPWKHIISLCCGENWEAGVAPGIWQDLPALQQLTFRPTHPSTSTTLPPLLDLTSLTTLALHTWLNHEEPELSQLLEQCLPSLHHLKELEVANCHEHHLPTLPPSWSSLQQLSKLRLEGFELSADSGVWQLTRLEDMALEARMLTPSVKLQAFHRLKQLSLCFVTSTNASTDADTDADTDTFLLPPDVLTFFPSSLTSLRLGTSGHQDELPGVLCSRWLASMSPLSGNLKTLTLECGALPEPSVGLITQITSLQELDLSYRSSPTAFLNPLQALATMTQLTSLSLDDRVSQWEMRVAMLPSPADLQGMTRLQALHLDGRVSLASVRHVPSSLTSLRSPVVAGGSGVMPLPDSLRHCQSLAKLAVTKPTSTFELGNLFFPTNASVGDPACTLGCLAALQSLELDDCCLATIPATLLFLTNLCLRVSSSANVAPPAWLHSSTRIKSLKLDGFSAVAPTFPPGLTCLDVRLSVHARERCALLQHWGWGCNGLRSLVVDADGGISGVSYLTALTSLNNLVLEGVMDPDINCLDSLSMLTCLSVTPKMGYRVTYWLPQLKALEEQGLCDCALSNCYEELPVAPECDSHTVDEMPRSFAALLAFWDSQ